MNISEHTSASNSCKKSFADRISWPKQLIALMKVSVWHFNGRKGTLKAFSSRLPGAKRTSLKAVRNEARAMACSWWHVDEMVHNSSRLSRSHSSRKQSQPMSINSMSLTDAFKICLLADGHSASSVFSRLVGIGDVQLLLGISTDIEFANR